MATRLLLVNPKFPESFWSFKWAIDRVLPAQRTVNPPLGLATLAALCPPDWQVTVVDENIETIECDSDRECFKVKLSKEKKAVHVLPLTVVAPAESGDLDEVFTMTIDGRPEPLTFRAHGKIVGG